MGNAKGTSNFVTITEAARELNMTRQGVWQQIKSGSINAMNVGGTYIIQKAEVRKFRKERITDMKRQLSALVKMEETGI